MHKFRAGNRILLKLHSVQAFDLSEARKKLAALSLGRVRVRPTKASNIILVLADCQKGKQGESSVADAITQALEPLAEYRYWSRESHSKRGRIADATSEKVERIEPEAVPVMVVVSAKRLEKYGLVEPPMPLIGRHGEAAVANRLAELDGYVAALRIRIGEPRVHEDGRPLHGRGVVRAAKTRIVPESIINKLAVACLQCYVAMARPPCQDLVNLLAYQLGTQRFARNEVRNILARKKAQQYAEQHPSAGNTELSRVSGVDRITIYRWRESGWLPPLLHSKGSLQHQKERA